MISYSGLTNYGKSSLPSPEGWGQTMNITKDPPRSIMTRYIEKVGQNNYLNDTIEEGDDRAGEYISVYARGVNPSVNVNYGNQAQSSIQPGHQGGSAGRIGVNQSYLPYRIMKDGAFRPPVMTKEELTPLSRQARPNTRVFTQAYFPNYTKSIVEDHEEYKAIKANTLHTSVKPTATYRIEKPLDYFDTSNSIRDSIPIIDSEAGKSRMRAMDIGETTNCEPIGGIRQKPLYAYTYTNKADINGLNNFNQVDVTEPTGVIKNALNVSYDTTKTGYNVDTKNYQDIHLNKKLSSEFTTNKFQNIEAKPVDSQYQIELKSNRPLIEVQAQKTSIGSFAESGSRDVRLAPTLNYGELQGKGSLPMRIEERVSVKLKDRKM